MTIYHRHHIIPKHMGGTDHPENLVQVTVEQHANLHKQLWEDLGYKEDYIAWKFLSNQITCKEAIKMVQKLPKSEEHRKKMSIAAKNRKDLTNIGYNLGKSNIGRKHSNYSKNKMSQSRKGTKNHFFGKKHKDETKKRLSEAAKNTKWYNNGIDEKKSKSVISGWNLGRLK